jgi:hypothetical protein
MVNEGKEREEEGYIKMAKVLSCRVLEGTSVGILLSDGLYASCWPGRRFGFVAPLHEFSSVSLISPLPPHPFSSVCLHLPPG